jgi:hypothetical protein
MEPIDLMMTLYSPSLLGLRDAAIHAAFWIAASLRSSQ